jgi:integrase
MAPLPKDVHRVVAKGKPYYYFHPRRGTASAGTRIRLPDDPGSPAFWEAYKRLSGRAASEAVPPRSGTFLALIAAYRESPEWRGRAESTRKLNEGHMAIIADVWGGRLVRGLRSDHVLQLRDTFADTPRKADHLVDMLSTLIRWGIPRRLAGEINPCAVVDRFGAGEGWAAWAREDLDHAARHLPPHLWWAAALAAFTGQRQGDVLRMDWAAIEDGVIAVRQAKTGKQVWVPIHADLAPILAAIPKRSTRILTNTDGRPWASGFKSSWGKAMQAEAFADFRSRRLVFHGLRKFAVNALLEAGCTDGEVAAITGQSREMIVHYSKQVNQRKLAASAMVKWQNEQPGNADCKTDAPNIVKLGGRLVSDAGKNG